MQHEIEVATSFVAITNYKLPPVAVAMAMMMTTTIKQTSATQGHR